MINLVPILFLMTSFCTSGTDSTRPQFESSKLEVLVEETTPVTSPVARLRVQGVQSEDLDCRITSDDVVGLEFFSVMPEGLACVVTVRKELTMLRTNSNWLVIEAKNTKSGANALTNCIINVARNWREMFCKETINVTVNSYIDRDFEVDIPCLSEEGVRVTYELRLPPQDLQVTFDDIGGKIFVTAPIPCGVDYDYMSIIASTHGTRYEIKINFHIEHSPPVIRLELINLTWNTAAFGITIIQPRSYNRTCSSLEDNLSYQYVLEVMGDDELAISKGVFAKDTTELYITVWGLKPSTDYVAVLRVEGHFNLNAAPVAFSTVAYDNRYNFTTIDSYVLLRTWRKELANKSSPDFLLTKFYVEDLIDHLMSRRPSFYDSEVLSFEPKSMLVSLTERVSKPGQKTDISQYLRQRLNSGFERPDTWTFGNLRGIVLQRTVPSSPPIFEESPVKLSCIFIIVHSLDNHNFQISWQLDGSPINLTASRTFLTEQERFAFKSTDTGMDIGNLTTYFYRHNLNIPTFRFRHTGKYSCHMMTWNKTSSSKIEDTLYTDISEEQVIEPTYVSISPLVICALEGSVVTLNCSFSNANEIVFVDHQDKVLKTYISKNTQGIIQMSVSSSLYNEIQCQGRLQNYSTSLRKSQFAKIAFLERGPYQCPCDVDDTGIQWATTPAGETAVQACPNGYQGNASRQCHDDGMWKPSKFIHCIRDDWISIEEEIRRVTEDGVDISSQFINNVMSRIQNLINSGPILSGDIQRVASILEDLGVLTFQNKKDALVEYQALDTSASITETILSSSEREWEDVLQYEKNNSMIGSGNKIIVAMDQIVAASMRTPSVSSSPIVKEKIAIKPSTLVLDDINFPDDSHENYQRYDNWVLNSGNKAFLSGSALKTDGIRYAVILLRDVSSVLSVDPTRQNLSEHGKAFQNKQVKSSIISFSLSHDNNPLSSPLEMTFKISQDHFQYPICGFLDTSAHIWSDESCETVTSGSNTVQCLCSHLTNFAVLMSPAGTTDETHKILSTITYVGCGISIVFLLITVAVHFSVWRYIKSDRVQLHVHLCICLLLSFGAFLGGINRTENENVCTVVAAVLHYLFLASFFLMLGEGIHIFLSVTIVFHHKSVLLKLLLFAYGIPLLIVGTSLGILKPSDYRSDDFCWLERGSGAIWAFIGPAAFIILVNFVIFGCVLKAVLRDQSPGTFETRSDAKSTMRSICVLSPILGLTWIFGLLAVNEDLVVFQYLFAIFNSLQGLFIFLFHCAFSSKVRSAIKAARRKQRAKSLDLTPKSSSSNHAERSRVKAKCMTDKDAEDRTRKQSASSILSVIEADSCANTAYENSAEITF